MAIQEIRLPEISENVDSGDVVKVLVKEGDTVEVDQSLVELETEKAVFEVPSTQAGIVKEIRVKEGDTIKVGEVIAAIDTGAAGAKGTRVAGGEKVAPAEAVKEVEESVAATGGAGAGETSEARPEAPAPVPSKRRARDESRRAPAAATAAEAPAPAGGGRGEPPAPASPTVRRLARELGVAIGAVPGSGSEGRITSEDVQRFAKAIISGERGALAATLPDFSRWGEVERVAMTKVRQVTARSMAAAWSTVPHVTQHDEADVTDLEEARARYASRVEAAGGKLTVTAILLRVCASALRAFPEFNASVDAGNQEIVYKRYVNIGVAVDTDRGLLVPVVRDADRKNIVALSVELTDLAARARDKKIKPEELEGGNFTISNLGGIGGTAFTPIVYHPEVAILGVSRAVRRPVYRDDAEGPVPRLMLPLSLSYDHRLIDGAQAARFLRWVAEALENPILVALEG